VIVKIPRNQLTHFLVSNHCSLFMIESCKTRFGTFELDKTICLLDCDLSKLSVLVKDMKDVSLRHLFGREISCAPKSARLISLLTFAYR
jgi:hypothetical protein